MKDSSHVPDSSHETALDVLGIAPAGGDGAASAPDLAPWHHRKVLLSKSCLFHDPAGARVAEVAIVIVRATTWRRDFDDPAWSVVPFGPLVVALRLTT